jgi:phenylalanyl-tRNA synthetase beta chain
MLVPYSWLKEYTEIPFSPEELAERLTMSGAKVEGIHYPAKGMEEVLIGRIESRQSHPDMEQAWIVQVDIGSRKVTTVSTAPNVLVGALVPIAMPGTKLSAGEVRVAKIRGVESEGMLCSEAELGVGEDSTGLMILDHGQPGQRLIELLGLDDAVIEFEIYPNRPDCLSIIGIVREVAALTGALLKLPEPEMAPASQSGTYQVNVEAPDLCSRYSAQIVEGVKIGPSPGWMQQRLRSAGMRPINNVVDITNYVMLEIGQPMHAFDLDYLQGGQIIVRRAWPGEKITTLDENVRELDRNVLVIADANRAVAIAGVMGGQNSEVSLNTANVLLEAATFNPASIRRTSRRIGIRSEASARFEKGLDPQLPLLALARASQLLKELAGGQPAKAISDVYQKVERVTHISLRPERVNSLLGTDLTPDDMQRCLRKLHFKAELLTDSRLKVEIPSYRRDIEKEVDLIEEIARIYGYDKIAPTIPLGGNIQGKQSLKLQKYDLIRERLQAAGLFESITYSFMNPDTLAKLKFGPGDIEYQAIPIINPLSEDQSLLRTTLLPNIIDVLSKAARRGGINDVQLFELGSVFIPKSLPLTEQPKEKPTLAIALMGNTLNAGWGRLTHPVDFFDAKGLIQAVGELFDVTLELTPDVCPPMHPGRCAQVIRQGKKVGVIGELHPDIVEEYDLPSPVVLAEIDLTDILVGNRKIRFQSLEKYPAVQRDLAFLVPVKVTAQEIQAVLYTQGSPLLRRAELFDVYQGKQIPEGYRSMAYTLIWQAQDRTLTDKEVNVKQEQIIQELEALGVKIRA